MSKGNHSSDSVFVPSAEEALGVEDTYKEYFLQYASYVITDRAIPDIEDGLKPVQRRILHSLWENEDGRFNKVANLVGHCMKYHPHGDASIFSALVGLGQKGFLIDTQGNWGDPVTNDSPAAARYIEARLTPFAREVAFAPHLTRYKLSYDGRNREPLALPVRFPLLLLTGAEGIAVGLTTRILPHNFIELLEAQKAYLKGEPFHLLPDFPTGALMDAQDYQDGAPGSRVRVRARLEPEEGKSLIVREVPFGTTTESVIDSILRASEKGKIKVANIQDNSAARVEIVVTFQRGVDMEKARDALYAFTDCEISLASNCVVIRDGHPAALTVSELLIDSARRTRELLRRDLEIQLEKQQRQWHLRSLVQIFVENRIYLRIEKCVSWEDVLGEIERGLQPFRKMLRREITEEDLIYLTEVRIRRISAWDAAKAREELEQIDQEISRIEKHLKNVTRYTIAYIDRQLEKFGKGRERRTEIASFDSVQAAAVVERTQKLFVEPRAGFVGTDLKDAQEVGSCSPLDDVLTILEDGGLLMTRVAERRYVGENIVRSLVFRPRDKDRVFNLVYEDVKSGWTYVKRFTVGGFTRDRRYELGKTKKTRILFIGEGYGVFAYVRLKKRPRIKTDIYVRFDEHLVKGRSANGVILTKHAVSSVQEISEAVYCNRLGLSAEDLPTAPADGQPEQAPPDDTRNAPAKQKDLFDAN
ncbi:MAG TPA: DNA gyrase/topoisomerase IV subunit A [Acidobacteriota bacterium]|nr:DNA gyrase/topoisomerase IV subunit A [Acidobacteriota bacterium]